MRDVDIDSGIRASGESRPSSDLEHPQRTQTPSANKSAEACVRDADIDSSVSASGETRPSPDLEHPQQTQTPSATKSAEASANANETNVSGRHARDLRARDSGSRDFRVYDLPPFKSVVKPDFQWGSLNG